MNEDGRGCLIKLRGMLECIYIYIGEIRWRDGVKNGYCAVNGALTHVAYGVHSGTVVMTVRNSTRRGRRGRSGNDSEGK